MQFWNGTKLQAHTSLAHQNPPSARVHQPHQSFAYAANKVGLPHVAVNVWHDEAPADKGIAALKQTTTMSSSAEPRTTYRDRSSLQTMTLVRYHIKCSGSRMRLAGSRGRSAASSVASATETLPFCARAQPKGSTVRELNRNAHGHSFNTAYAYDDRDEVEPQGHRGSWGEPSRGEVCK